MTGWFTGPGIGVLNGIFLRLDCTNDPLTAGLEINAATAGEPVLILQTTDDNAANPTLEIQNAAGAMLGEWQSRGGLNFAAAVGQATPGLIGLAGARFLHTYGTDNLFLGVDAGNFTLTGTGNFGAGYQCGQSLTTGRLNWFAGYQAGRSTTTGRFGFAGGYQALENNIGADYNSALGYQALRSNTTGWGGVGFGAASLASNTTGTRNVGIGHNSLLSNVGGIENTAIGSNALRTSVSGQGNVAIGLFAMYNSLSHYNVAIGSEAAVSQTTGAWNIAIGYRASRYNQAGFHNVVIGYKAGHGVATRSNYRNVFLGYQAAYGITTGGRNLILGYQAGHDLTTGDYNVFIGHDAGHLETINSNRLYIANSNTATPLIYGEFDNRFLRFHSASAVTNAIEYVTRLSHVSSNVPAAGFGVGQKWQLETTTTEHQDAAGMVAVWVDPTHATRKAYSAWNVYDTAVREGVRIQASGTAPMIGFLGAAPVVRAAAYTLNNRTDDRVIDCNATTLDEVADVLATIIYDLQQLGLVG